MSFKIQNISNSLPIRDFNYKKSITVVGVILHPEQSIIINSKVLPISVRTLQLEGKITITHISDLELKSILKPINISDKPKSVVKKVEVIEKEKNVTIPIVKEKEVIKKNKRKRKKLK